MCETMVASKVAAVLCAAFVSLVVAGVNGLEEEECSSAYNYLAGCLTFVSGPDVIPNPVCCGGVTHLSTDDPHCLCVVIQELDENPTVNFTKACALPRQCRAAVDPGMCPSLSLGSSISPSLPASLLGEDSAATLRFITPFQLVAVAVILTAFLLVLFDSTLGQWFW